MSMEGANGDGGGGIIRGCAGWAGYFQPPPTPGITESSVARSSVVVDVVGSSITLVLAVVHCVVQHAREWWSGCCGGGVGFIEYTQRRITKEGTNRIE